MQYIFNNNSRWRANIGDAIYGGGVPPHGAIPPTPYGNGAHFAVDTPTLFSPAPTGGLLQGRATPIFAGGFSSAPGSSALPPRARGGPVLPALPGAGSLPIARGGPVRVQPVEPTPAGHYPVAYGHPLLPNSTFRTEY
jgi:hypothetical protein